MFKSAEICFAEAAAAAAFDGEGGGDSLLIFLQMEGRGDEVDNN